VEATALPALAVQFETAAMERYNIFCDGQAQTGALGAWAVLAVQLSKRFKNKSLLGLADSDAGIFDLDPDFPILHHSAQGDRPTVRRELVCVPYKVEQDLVDLFRVT